LTQTELDILARTLNVKNRRGFTGHEHLDRTGITHMNGRVYDPVLASFLSPDLLVSAPNFSQSYNRYSYVWNNPLGMTDALVVIRQVVPMKTVVMTMANKTHPTGILTIKAVLLVNQELNPKPSMTVVSRKKNGL
jgi:RHS repeat-associated protein